jgi:hypothetical protein
LWETMWSQLRNTLMQLAESWRMNMLQWIF